MKIRKGKNIFFKLAVTLPDGSPENFSTARDINISISSLTYKYLPEITFNDNIISFEYPGDKNVHLGEFGIHLKYVKPNAMSITNIEPFFLDIFSAFEIVSSSAEEDFDESIENPEMTAISIAGQMNILGISQGTSDDIEKRVTSLEKDMYGDGAKSVSYRISQSLTWEEHK